MRTTYVRWASAACMALMIVTAALGAQTRSADAAVMLQAAVHQETVNGNLDSAITLYRRVAEDRRADRPTVAKALVSLGRAYETLGQGEATRAYQRVVNEFGDQSEQVTMARQRLVALARPDANAKTTVAGGLSLRRIWHDPGVDMEGQPTPDGHLLTFVDWETGDMAVREVATGTQRRLTKTGYPQYALGSSVSRDGRQVAYFWTLGEGKAWQPQLRVIGIDGTVERILVANVNREITYLTPYEWTPDGRHVLVVLSKNAGNEIALIDAWTGAVRTVKSMDWRRPMRAALSPDGRWIAYDFPVTADAPERDLFVLAADGSVEHQLTGDPANDLHAIWISDSEVLFSSLRGGSVGLWRARVRNGRAQGEPELVKGDMTPGFYPMGVTADGTLFYSQDTGGGDIYTVAFDLAAARAVGEPKKFVQRYQGLNLSGHFSPKGDLLAYMSRRDALSMGHTVRLFVQDLKTGVERPLNAYSIRQGARPRISPDGKHILLWTRGVREGERIFVVDLASGESRPVFDPILGAKSSLRDPVWSRDGRHIYYFRRDDVATGRVPRIVKREMASGHEQVVHRFDLVGVSATWALSPDEQSIAYAGVEPGSEIGSGDYRVHVAPLGGQSRELARVPRPQAASSTTGVAWTPDGRHILYGVQAGERWVQDPNVTLYAVPIDGGTLHETGLRLPDLRHVTFLPDGRTLSFTAGPHGFNEVWMMENVRRSSSR